jgi:6-phosphogluconolactonase
LVVVPYNVAMYTIDATTGALASIGTIAAGTVPVSVAVDPAGKFAYVPTANYGSAGSVSMYAINATTGALASMGTIAAGTGPVSVAVDPCWQVRLRDEFRLERCLDVHHRRHDRGLDI